MSTTLEPETHRDNSRQHDSRRGTIWRGKNAWHGSAPKRLVRLFGANEGDAVGPDEASIDSTKVWQAWGKHLDCRSDPRSLAELLEGSRDALMWCAGSLVDEDHAARIQSWLFPLGTRRSKESLQSGCDEWLSLPFAEDADAADVLEALAVAHALPAAAQSVEPSTWWEVLTRLVELARAAETAVVRDDAEPRDAILIQLVAGELPLTLGHLFGELKVCRKLRETARATLSGGPIELLDSEGMPHSRYLPVARPLLACWTRCQAMAETHKKNCWNKEAENQFEWFVRQMIRFTRGDGSQMLTAAEAGSWSRPLFTQALRLAGDEDDVAAARLALPARIGDADDEGLPPEAAAESEWGSIAILRSDFRRTAPRLAVSYDTEHVSLELSAGGESLLLGTCQTQLISGGKAIAADGEWEQSCWYSDDDVDFLEISIDLDGGGILERQFLLAREDDFLLVQDVVVTEGGPIDYRASFPLAAATETAPFKETREIRLKAAKGGAVVMPLALPEWRIGSQGGELAAKKGQLVLKQKSTLGSVVCPLMFDLAPRRWKKPRTWRQLTVAQALEIVSPDEAVGYRIQAGNDHWLVYRAVKTRANRTLLGQNLSCEFYLGRIDRDGETEELLEIEG